MGKLTADEARKRLGEIPGWTMEREVISRQFTFPGFPDAIAFVVRLGFAAEGADHHPDVVINYKRVTVSYSTHSEGGLTQKDFDGARTATTIAVAVGGS